MDLVTTKKILEVRVGDAAEREDRLVVEAPLTIFLNGEELVTLLCTPEKLEQLALGFLRSEGLLLSMDEVKALRLREEGLVEVETTGEQGLAGRLFGKRTITSGCGKGTTFYNALDSLRSRPVRGKVILYDSQVWSLVKELHEKAGLFKHTGGVHSAALAGPEGILFFCEDIGRHNAVDKIVGECLRHQIELEDKILVSSGRLSSEILLKTAKLQIPVLISRSAPTSLSVELAEKLNITLIGFVRGSRMNIYTHPWRIKRDKPVYG